MHLRLPAILVAARRHGETAVVARFLTGEHGIVAGYVAGGRGRNLRPVLIPGNVLNVEFVARQASQLLFARPELVVSRGPWIAEPLPAAGISWACTLTAAALPERQPFAPLYEALSGLVDAICNASSARLWAGALVAYETLVLRELGYGGPAQAARPMQQADICSVLAAMDHLAPLLERYLLADRRANIIAARHRLRDLFARMA